MTRFVLVVLLTTLLVGCGGEGNGEPVKVVSTTTGCTDPQTEAEKLVREALQSQGALIGETVTLRIVGCQIVGTYSYEEVNAFSQENPEVTDPGLFPQHPARELREWAEASGLGPKTVRQTEVNWIETANPTQKVCSLLAGEGLTCE